MKGRRVVLGLACAGALAAPALANEGCEGVRTPQTSRLQVRAEGVRPLGGQLIVTVYPDDRMRFLAPHGKVARLRVPARDHALACFWLPPAGYAVAVHHDKDNDRRLDWNIFGPAEGGGFSNDPNLTVMRPPFDKARFELPAAGRELTIHMKYPR